jgi:hypothetical protein
MQDDAWKAAYWIIAHANNDAAVGSALLHTSYGKRRNLQMKIAKAR